MIDEEAAEGELVPRVRSVEELTPAELRKIQTTWAPSRVACATLGCSMRKLQHLLDQELIPRGAHYVIKGARYIDPEALEHIKTGDISSQEQPELAKVIVDGMRVMTASVAAHQEHADRFVTALLTPIERQQEILLRHLESMAKENERLQEKIRAMLAAHEDAQSLQNERDVILTQEAGRQTRITEAWGLLREYVPRLLDGATGVRKLKKLLVGLDDDRLAKLREFKLIDEDEEKAIRDIRSEEQRRLERLKTKLRGSVSAVAEAAGVDVAAAAAAASSSNGKGEVARD